MKQFFFKAGLAIQIFLIVAHLSYNRHGLPIPDINQQSHELLDLMANYKIQFSFGPERTMDQTIWGYDLTWASLILFTTLISILALKKSSNSIKTGKYVSGSNVVLWLLCFVAAFIFWSPPQQIFFGILLFLFLVSFIFEWREPKLKDTRICVVGAGISGLTAAYELNKKGYRNITVLEKASYIGGKCETLVDDDKPFDLGGHEMLAGYYDVVNIGKELNAPTRRSIPPVVYDSNQKKYLNFTQSATANRQYSLIQVGIATLRYLWLTGVTFHKYSNPSNGYRNIPDELTKSLDDWLEYRNLNAIKDILVFVIKVQGYGQFQGTAAAYLVKFMGWKNWGSLLLSGMGIYMKWPRVFTYGMQNLCERMAATLSDVRTQVNIKSIERSNAAKDGIKVFLEGKENPIVFDKLIVATSLEKSSLGFLNLPKPEEELFDSFKSYRFYTTFAEVQGLDAGVVASNPMNNIQEGEYTGYIKDFTEEPYAIFFSLAMSDKINGDVVKEKIEKVLKGVVAFKGVQPKVDKFLFQKEWKYFPHIPLPENGGKKVDIQHVYNTIESMQGKLNTYFVSSALSFECVGNSVSFSLRIVRDNFK